MNRLNRPMSIARRNPMLPRATRLTTRRPLVLATVEAVERRQLLASVAGMVYNDANANGTRQAGEAGINGEVVYADRNNNNTYDAGDVATRTDASGAYALANLPADGTTITIRIRGDDGKRVVTPAGDGYAVKLTAAAPTVTGKDFALKPVTPPPPATTVTVSGRAFYDRDSSGTYSAGDTTTSTVVFADLNANFQLDAGEPSATPAADGTFTIANAPASKTFNLVALGIGGAGIGKGLTITTPAAGGSLAGVAIYSQPAKTTPTTATLTGRVTNDANGNGVADGGEPGLASEVVYLDRNNNGTYDAGDVATRTDANGNYSFTNVALDNTTVGVRLRSIVSPRTVTAPANGVYTLSLNANATTSSLNFSVSPTKVTPTSTNVTVSIVPKIAGLDPDAYAGFFQHYYVWNDIDADGIRDANEPLIGQREVGYDAALNGGGLAYDVVVPAGTSYHVGLSSSASVNATAAYEVSGVAAASNGPVYKLVDVAPIQSTIYGAIYIDSNRNGTFDAGEKLTTSAGVYADYNGNGVHDAGEPSTNTYAGDDPTGDQVISLNKYRGFYFLTVTPGQAFTVQYAGSTEYPSDTGIQTGPMPRVIVSAGQLAYEGIFIGAKSPSTATLSGRVTNDANGNGIADTGEAGLASEVVYFDRNNNATYDTGDVAVRTDANGNYSIPNVALDGSTVAVRLRSIAAPRTVTAPAGNVYTITLNASATTTNLNFSVSPTTPPPTTATITGRINDDANGNGVADSGEGGLANVLVFADYNNDGFFDGPGSLSVEDFALTNSAGVYSLNVKPGAFTIRTYNPAREEIDPDLDHPYFFGINAVPIVQTGPAGNGGRPVTAAAGSTTNNVNFTAITATYARVSPKLANLDAESTYLFSNEVTGYASPDLTYAWLDANKNGILDAGETVTAANPELFDVRGNAYGNAFYDFFLQRGSNQIDFGISNAVGTKSIGSQVVQVTATTPSEIFPQVTIATTGSSVFGEIFNDANGNGVLDTGEGGYNSEFAPPTFEVFADYNGNGAPDPGEPSAYSFSSSDFTGGNGYYALHGLDPTKSFTIRIDAASLPAGTVVTNTPNLTVGTNQFVTGENIGLTTASSATITGRVADGSNKGVANLTAFADYNGNGVLDANEPSAKTNSAGVYSFASTLSAYSVQLMLAGNGYVQTTPASNAGVSFDVTHLAHKDNVNFVVAPSATVTGRISNDANLNGTADAGEGGLARVTVYADYVGNGHYYSGEPTAVTNAEGVYSLETTRSAFTVRIYNPSSYKVSEDIADRGRDSLYAQTGPNGLNAGVAIDVTSKARLDNVNFSAASAGYAVVAPQTTAADASLKDLFGVGGPVYVWVDANGNGLRDANEPLVSKDSTTIPSPPDGPEYSYYPVLLPAGVTSQIAFASSNAVGAKANTIYTMTVAANAAHADPDSVTVPTTESGVFAEAATGYTNPYVVGGITVYADYNNNDVRDADEPETDVYGDIYGIREGNNFFYLPVDANRTFTLRAFDNFVPSSQSNAPVLTVAPNTTVTNVDLGFTM